MTKSLVPEKRDKQVTIKLTSKTYDDIVKLALEWETKKSTVIRLILEDWLSAP